MLTIHIKSEISWFKHATNTTKTCRYHSISTNLFHFIFDIIHCMHSKLLIRSTQMIRLICNWTEMFSARNIEIELNFQCQKFV